KHIVGLLEPDAGEVEVDGQIVHLLDRPGLASLRATIGYVFQFAALLDSMTVRDNLLLGLRRRGLSAAEMEERVVESLELVDLRGTEERFPAELSGGMRKRVGIARAIALRPRYILYDEPTTGLDPVTAAVIDRLMVRTRQRLGVTGLVVTHDMRSAYAVGDRVEGSGVRVGRVRQIRLGETNWVEAELQMYNISGLPANPAVIAASASLFGEWQAGIVPFDQAIDDPSVRRDLDDAAKVGG